MIIYFFWIAIGVACTLAVGLISAIAGMLGLKISDRLVATWRCLMRAWRGR